MDSYLKYYIYGCSFIWLCSILLALWRRSDLHLKVYLSFLLQKWKIITGVLSTSGLVIIGPFTGDPTWDFATASFMSVLTFSTAPWSVGILYRFVRRQEPLWQAYIAACLWLFSASWSYDLYLLIRDGYYPVTWSSNLVASSILYLCAGLFWNLSFTQDRGVHLAFTESNWPEVPKEEQFSRIILYALPFMILVSAMILYFVVVENF